MRIRIKIQEILNINECFELGIKERNHVCVVLRRGVGDIVYLFNDNYEYTAEIVSVSKKKALVKVLSAEIYIIQKKKCKINLVCPIIKKDNMLTAIRQATELGVDSISIIRSSRSLPYSPNEEKIKEKIKSAIEQSEQFRLPGLTAEVQFQDFINRSDVRVIVFSERKARSMEAKDSYSEAIEFIKDAICSDIDQISIMFGPEGGFSKSEYEMMKSNHNIMLASLGSEILTSETAIVSGVQLMKTLICMT